MPQPQGHISIRRKVTMACEVCRKRRIKCSGIVPCQYCVVNKRQCWIDKSGRGRRGPRPQARESTGARLSQSDAPNTPPLGPPAVGSNSVVSEDDAAIDVEPVQDDESEDEHDAPPVPLSQSDIERVLFEGKSASNPSDKTQLGLVCHLLELHWRRTSGFLHGVLPIEEFARGLASGNLPRRLLLAMCACNARFSVHILTRPSKTSNLGSYFEQQARQGLSGALANGFGISDLRVCCFLIEHAINSGSGGRAWSDIALAETLVQLASAGQALDSDAEALAAVSQYLAVARAIMCIGNPDLHSTQQRAPQHSMSSATSDTPVWRRLWILLRIQELCRKPFTQQEPRPWDEDSDFRCIQEELDGFMIRWPGPSSTAFSDTCPKDPESSIALLVSHCSIILLNRTFLPIPRKRIGCREGGHDVHWVNFPSAPDLFIRERISRCEASVAAICLVCRDLIADGQFFAQSFWIGLSCVLSALVMISRLHAGSISKNNMVESLKFTFTIVVSLRQFLKPANDWVEMLFHLYDAAACLDRDGYPAGDSFLSYFDRYPGIQDKIKIPLSWKPSPAPSPRQKQSPHDCARSEAPITESEAPCQEAAWIQVYTDQLDLDMALPDQLEAANTSTGSTLGRPVPNDGFNIDVSEMLTLILNDNLEHPQASAANEAWPAPLVDVDIDLQNLESFFSAFPTDLLGPEDSMGLEGELDGSLQAMGNLGIWQ